MSKPKTVIGDAGSEARLLALRRCGRRHLIDASTPRRSIKQRALLIAASGSHLAPLAPIARVPFVISLLLLTLRQNGVVFTRFAPGTQPLYVNISNKNAPLLFAFISKENIHAKYCDCNIHNFQNVVISTLSCNQLRFKKEEARPSFVYLNARSIWMRVCGLSLKYDFGRVRLALAVSKRWDDWDGNWQLPLVPLRVENSKHAGSTIDKSRLSMSITGHNYTLTHAALFDMLQ